MNKQAVKQKMELFLEHLREEQEIRDELVSLQFFGVSEGEIKQSLTRQKELLGQLDSLRKEKMLPILTEMADFVALRKAELGIAKPAGAEAKAKAAPAAKKKALPAKKASR